MVAADTVSSAAASSTLSRPRLASRESRPFHRSYRLIRRSTTPLVARVLARGGRVQVSG
jgi:hypothetical protein